MWWQWIYHRRGQRLVDRSSTRYLKGRKVGGMGQGTRSMRLLRALLAPAVDVFDAAVSQVGCAVVQYCWKGGLAVVVAGLSQADKVAPNLVDPRNSLNGKSKRECK